MRQPFFSGNAVASRAFLSNRRGQQKDIPCLCIGVCQKGVRFSVGCAILFVTDITKRRMGL